MRRVARNQRGDLGVLIADLSGFSATTEARGDEAAADLALRFISLARRALRPWARVVNTMGDAVLAVARSGEAGMDAAHALRAAVVADRALPSLHIGVAAGPVVWRGRSVYGATVNRAARLAQQAGPGEIQADLAMLEHAAFRVSSSNERLRRGCPFRRHRLLVRAARPAHRGRVVLLPRH